MPSPPRQSRGSPRRALHERSDSQTNERDRPLSWRSGNAQAVYYEETPYPTKPSQILRPSRQYSPVKGLDTREEGFEDEPTSAWGDQNSSMGRSVQRSPAESPLFSLPGQRSTASPGDSSRNLVTSTPAASIRMVEDEPSFIGTTSEDEIHERDQAITAGDRQPSNKDSDNSLSSANTTGTVVVRKARDGKKHASYSAFPYVARPSSSRSNLSGPTSRRSSPRIPDDQGSSKSSASPTTSESIASPSNEHVAPAEARQITPTGEGKRTRLQYPIIKPPSASGSWAESTSEPPQIPPRAAERAQQRWNPHLSTVPSEGRSSASVERASQGMWLSDSSRGSKASSNAFSPRKSSDRTLLPTDASSSLSHGVLSSREATQSPPLGPPPIRHRDFSGSTIRIVDEEEIPKLKVPPTIPGSRDSANVEPAATEGASAELSQRPSSRASFFRDSIPAWARSYYARPMSSSSLSPQRDSTATDNISINMFRPRTRRPAVNNRPSRRISGLNMHPTHPDPGGTTNVIGIRRPQGMSPRWSPHLWHDRMSLYHRRSLFKAPSIDEAAEGKALTKRNAQIILFAVGFVLPLTWFVAAFLPLPPKPAFLSEKGKSAVRETQASQDLERQLGPTDWARYENARWWRKINRIMCGTGFVVILIVIIMAAVTAS